MKISDQEAERILRINLAKIERRVSYLVKVLLSDNHNAKLVSFDFNTGALHKSTLLKSKIIASTGGLLFGLSGMASGAGPIQWALAIVLVAAFTTSIYFLNKRMQDQAV